MNNKKRVKRSLEESSERKQAEFLKYLLTHASSPYQTNASALYSTARLFLNTMFSQMGSELPDFEYADVQCIKSSNHLLITLDQQHRIILQSHVSSGPSNNTLAKLARQLVTSDNVEPKNIYPILLKTQYEFTVDRTQFIFPLITRKELLEILFGDKTKGITDSTFNDYRMWLAEIDQELSGFRNHPPSEWDYKEWIGYSNLMEEEMNWGSYIFRADEADGQFEFLS